MSMVTKHDDDEMYGDKQKYTNTARRNLSWANNPHRRSLSIIPEYTVP
jgi:hypothetical protein